MTKVSLTFPESKTKISLNLESKDSGLTWNGAIWTWDEATGNWDSGKVSLTKESKTKADLTLESK
jgi:hypothetical protein